MVCPLLVVGSPASLTGFWALFWAVFENAVACLVLATFCPLPPINSDLLPLAAGAAVWPALVSLVFRLGAGGLERLAQWLSARGCQNRSDSPVGRSGRPGLQTGPRNWSGIPAGSETASSSLAGRGKKSTAGGSVNMVAGGCATLASPKKSKKMHYRCLSQESRWSRSDDSGSGSEEEERAATPARHIVRLRVDRYPCLLLFIHSIDSKL